MPPTKHSRTVATAPYQTMDFFKLLQSLEDLVFEVALWIILLPRTLFAVIFTPVTLANHFDDLQATPAAERNDLYVSPILFWVLLAPSSLIIAIARLDEKAIKIYGENWQERLAVGTLMLLGPPLGFALGTILARREDVSRKSLRRHFSLQCYFHAPVSVILVVAIALMENIKPRLGEDAASAIVSPLIFLPGAWFLITQYRVSRRDFQPLRATGSVALGCGLGFVVFLATDFMIGIVLFLIGRAPDLFKV